LIGSVECRREINIKKNQLVLLVYISNTVFCHRSTSVDRQKKVVVKVPENPGNDLSEIVEDIIRKSPFPHVLLEFHPVSQGDFVEVGILIVHLLSE
jgi:hypothetical protein